MNKSSRVVSVQRMLGAVAFVASGVASIGRVAAYPVDAAFAINPANSNLKIKATALDFSDDDTKSLTGTLHATFDFGQSGEFPSTANVTVNDGTVTPSGAYNLRLGFPPILGVDAVASGLAADVTTPAPPGVMTKSAAAGIIYDFDAAQFLVTLDQGTIDVTGSTTAMIDLADQPVSGSSPEGTLGTVTFTAVSTSGPYTLVNAALALPVNVSQTAPVGTISVELEMTATVNATASFYVALAGVPGDFDADGDVDATDLPRWNTGYGSAGSATASNGDADGDQDVDGDDFLIWQRNYGLAPPAIPATAAASAVPEPAGAVMMAAAIAAAAALSRRDWRQR